MEGCFKDLMFFFCIARDLHSNQEIFIACWGLTVACLDKGESLWKSCIFINTNISQVASGTQEITDFPVSIFSSDDHGWKRSLVLMSHSWICRNGCSCGSGDDLAGKVYGYPALMGRGAQARRQVDLQSTVANQLVNSRSKERLAQKIQWRMNTHKHTHDWLHPYLAHSVYKSLGLLFKKQTNKGLTRWFIS